MRTPTLNRQRVDLLRAVQAGKVYRSMGGCDLREVRRGQNQRVDRRLRELAAAGWVELAPGGRFHTLTEAGVLALSAVAS
ncbi:hypothetical protein AB0C02_27990 [Micromonospora sp. NPDC048999]|uniref:hypothetical protein n=1 Tax=Micromonospora sp. NPDC048999 TaxID=3155391 RepID=UPI0033FE602A